MTEPRQRDTIDKAVSDLKTFVHDLFLAAPDFTGNFTVNVKDGIILELTATRRYKLNQ